MHTTWNCIELQIFPQVNQMWFEKKIDMSESTATFFKEVSEMSE